MSFSHNKEKFNHYLKNKKNFVFFKKIESYKRDIVPNLIKIVKQNQYSFLYESVEKGKEKGRYTICGYNSIKKIELKKNKLVVASGHKKTKLSVEKNPLNKIDLIIKKNKFKKKKNLPPMVGSFFGFISYENIYKVESVNKFKKRNTLNTPDIILFIPKYLIVYDNLEETLFIIRHIIPKKNISFGHVLNKISRIENMIEEETNRKIIDLQKSKKIKIRSNFTKSNFIKIIKKAKSYIKKGDIFQVVPSQRFETSFNCEGCSLYEVLRQTNPSPFMYYFNLPKFQIVGSSPEILVRIRDNTLTVRPIAGTRPRGKNKKEDKKNELDLLSDKKELAEHLMLLDLGRNDVGKVSKKSSVYVSSKFIIEKYSHVMHIVSNVLGTLKKGTSPITALMAGFPAGTVTGAPKIRAMQIIDELENDNRGIYSGGIGYISPDGDMDTCIVLRTGIIFKNKLYVQAGGGVVYDSNPELEYMETVNKAKAVLNAASIVLGNKE